jgi:predicted nucleic acid-binding protein
VRVNYYVKCEDLTPKVLAKYSYWDSLIIASALKNNCSICYSEDMQHGQLIEDRLKVINPFKESER